MEVRPEPRNHPVPNEAVQGSQGIRRCCGDRYDVDPSAACVLFVRTDAVTQPQDPLPRRTADRLWAGSRPRCKPRQRIRSAHTQSTTPCVLTEAHGVSDSPTFGPGASGGAAARTWPRRKEGPKAPASSSPLQLERERGREEDGPAFVSHAHTDVARPTPGEIIFRNFGESSQSLLLCGIQVWQIDAVFIEKHSAGFVCVEEKAGHPRQRRIQPNCSAGRGYSVAIIAG